SLGCGTHACPRPCGGSPPPAASRSPPPPAAALENAAPARPRSSPFPFSFVRITIVLGFFLPVPPLAGGASEKSWHGLAREFAAQGHDVTVISREWPGLPFTENEGRVRHLRLRGYAHTANLARNLWRDFLWSLRVSRALPR